MFHIISLSFLLDCVLLSFPHHLKLNKKKKKLVQFYKTADTEDYSTHPFETSPPPPPPLSRSGAFIELPAFNAPFWDNRGGGGLISKGCARPRSHPVPIPFPQPLHSRQAGGVSVRVAEATALCMYAVKVRQIRDHVVRCHGSQECGSRFVNFACKFHRRWHGVRIILKSTTLLFMRSRK